MSINGSIIAAGPSVQKTDAATTVCNVVDPLVVETRGEKVLSFSTLSIIDGVQTYQVFLPQWHGQMIIVKGSEAEYGLMYIAYDNPIPPEDQDGQDSLLEWKSVNLRYVVADTRTGEKKNPFDGFY